MTKPAPDPEPLEVLRLELRLTAQERAAIGEMTRRGGFQSVTHVVLSGLWLLGRQLDLNLPIDVFGLKGR